MKPAAHESDSEFGYDFSTDDEELLLQLASNNDERGLEIDPVQPVRRQNGPASSLYPVSAATQENEVRSLPSPISLAEDVRYPNLSRALQDLETEELPPPTDATDDNSELDSYHDGRSPLQRFRSFPRKPLTVSDLTAGAWCELQYWYTLTRLPGGRRTRTQAMRQGSKLHQQLEDEVHTTVKIDIMTKEDGFGLRLWNLVQGLRTLRDTGLTRELEVWGMVGGNLVNGVIDSVSYEHPNPEFEEELSSQEPHPSRRLQTTLADYFPPKKSASAASSSSPKIYLTDIKTRGTLAPASPAFLRPAKIQLLLYHRFLSDMAARKLDFFKMFRRYGLDADERFSDSFMSQIGDLHDEIFFDTPASSVEQAEKDSDAGTGQGNEDDYASEDGNTFSPGAPDLLKYGTLRELVTLVRAEIALTFPLGAASLGHMLCVRYIFRDDGRELDIHDFPVSRQALDAYLAKYMEWWRGERRASGVDIEEAFKCCSCEFAASCSWRKGMDGERVKRAQEKVWAARRAASG